MNIATHSIEVPIGGMDCAECTLHVQHAIAALPGVAKVDVFLASEKAIVQLDPARVDLPLIRQAVQAAGYHVPERATAPDRSVPAQQSYTRAIFILFGVVFFAALLLLGVPWMAMIG